MNKEKLAQIAALAEPLSYTSMGSMCTCAIGEARKAGILVRAPYMKKAAEELGISFEQAWYLFGSRQTGAQCAEKIREFLVSREMG